MIVAEPGDSTRWSRAAGVTCSDAVPVLPALLPVTVCAPEVEAVQVAPVQEPSGPIVKRRARGHVAERVVVLVTPLRGVGLRAAGADRRRGRRKRQMVERPRVHGQRRRTRLARIGTGDGVAAGDRRRAGGAGTGAVGQDREGRARGHVAERVAGRVEALSRVALRTTGRDRRRRRADHDVIQRPARDLQRCRPGLAGAAAGDRVRARGGGGAGRARAGTVRANREARARGHVAERVVVLVTPLRGVGLRAAGADRRRGRRKRQMVERPGADAQTRVARLAATASGHRVRTRRRRGAHVGGARPIGRDRERRRAPSHRRASCSTHQTPAPYTSANHRP